MSFRSRLSLCCGGVTALVLLLAGGGAMSAQTVLGSINGTQAGEEFGAAVCGIGDINGDGVPDFIVGSPSFSPVNLPSAGRIRIISGATGLPLYTMVGVIAGQQLGFAVTGIGDVDGDGIPDFAAGAPALLAGLTGPPVPGTVSLWSGATGTLLRTYTSSTTADNFGGAIAGLGDVDGDGHPDIIVGAGLLSYAQVFSGTGSTIIHTVTGTAPSSGFGYAVGNAGDVDGDTRCDFLVGARTEAVNGVPVGAVHMFSGATGASLGVTYGNANGDQYGAAVAGIGSLDGTGRRSHIVGARNADANGVDSGKVRAVSGISNATIWTVPGANAGDLFGYAVADGGDLDGDGIPDVLVGAPLAWDGANTVGAVYVLSGATGTPLGVLFGDQPDDRRGQSVSCAHDVNADGIPDLVVGSPGVDIGGLNAGSAVVVSFGHVLTACGRGNVPIPGGGIAPLLSINGQTGNAGHALSVNAFQPINLVLAQPPSIAFAAPMAVFGYIGVPTPAQAVTLPLGIGSFCFNPALLAPWQPELFTLANSYDPLDPMALFPGTLTPWSLSYGPGLPAGITLGFQAIVNLGPNQFAASNAILMTVH